MCVDLTLAYAIGQGCHGEPTCIVRNYTVQLVDNFRQNSQKKLRLNREHFAAFMAGLHTSSCSLNFHYQP